MTELLEQAVERVRALPPDMQDEYALVLLRLVGDDGAIYRLTAEDEASLATSLGEAERGEFASDAQVRAIWAKHGL